MYLICNALSEASVGLAAGVVQLSSEIDVGKSCCGVKCLSICKEEKKKAL